MYILYCELPVCTRGSRFSQMKKRPVIFGHLRLFRYPELCLLNYAKDPKMYPIGIEICRPLWEFVDFYLTVFIPGLFYFIYRYDRMPGFEPKFLQPQPDVLLMRYTHACFNFLSIENYRYFNDFFKSTLYLVRFLCGVRYQDIL